MVSIGTVLSIGIIAGVGVLGYALYSNAGAIGSALSRGVTKSVTDPIGSYFENLFTGPGSTSPGPGPGPAPQQIDYKKQTEEINKKYQDLYQKQFGQTLKSYEDTLKVYQDTLANLPKDTPAPTVPASFPGEEHRSANPQAPLNEPLFTPSPAGYYYWNRPGPNDKQLLLKAGTADVLRRRGRELHFLTPGTKLTQTSFKVFGQSKQYL